MVQDHPGAQTYLYFIQTQIFDIIDGFPTQGRDPEFTSGQDHPGAQTQMTSLT